MKDDSQRTSISGVSLVVKNVEMVKFLNAHRIDSSRIYILDRSGYNLSESFFSHTYRKIERMNL